MPCRDCKDRREYCHSICPEYIEFKQDNEVRRQLVIKEQDVRNYTSKKNRGNWAYEKVR